MAFLTLHESASSSPYRPLIVHGPDICHQWIVNAHECHVSKAIHKLGWYLENDVTVSGRGHVYCQGKLMASEDILPRYWQKLIENRTIDPTRSFSFQNDRLGRRASSLWAMVCLSTDTF